MVISRELLEIRVEAPFACFTRPELKAERVSYPVITPSAARGVLEAIYWHPQFAWRVEEIWVLKPIRYFSIVRNEVSERAAANRVIIADQKRAQRHTLALRDVAYRIRARIALKPEADHPLPKYVECFKRRVAKGQCFAMPYLGCREFSTAFDVINPEEQAIQLTEDLGRMLHSLIYEEDGSGHATPRFFDARLENGVLHVPSLLEGEN